MSLFSINIPSVIIIMTNPYLWCVYMWSHMYMNPEACNYDKRSLHKASMYTIAHCTRLGIVTVWLRYDIPIDVHPTTFSDWEKIDCGTEWGREDRQAEKVTSIERMLNIINQSQHNSSYM